MPLTESYLQAVKQALRDQHGFIPDPEKSTEHALFFADGAIPDGEYLIIVNGHDDCVLIENGCINLCSFS